MLFENGSTWVLWISLKGAFGRFTVKTTKVKTTKGQYDENKNIFWSEGRNHLLQLSKRRMVLVKATKSKSQYDEIKKSIRRNQKLITKIKM